MTKCQWLWYLPAKVPKWPHLEKCDRPAEVEIQTEDGQKSFCLKHAEQLGGQG